MTIYYRAEWQAAGGPPHEGHCQFIEATIITRCDAEESGIMVVMRQNKWLVIDPMDGAILMDCPFNNHLGAATYVADYIRWMTDIQKSINRHPATYHKNKRDNPEGTNNG